uniref:Uncharacterized protein n=1 Tax=Opuntia streptacantha TaxID=393608 RepID=A0A7C8ZZW2_OPUST
MNLYLNNKKFYIISIHIYIFKTNCKWKIVLEILSAVFTLDCCPFCHNSRVSSKVWCKSKRTNSTSAFTIFIDLTAFEFHEIQTVLSYCKIEQKRLAQNGAFDTNSHNQSNPHSHLCLPTTPSNWW